MGGTSAVLRPDRARRATVGRAGGTRLRPARDGRYPRAPAGLRDPGFPRVRVGIGPKPDGGEMIEFVLGEFGEEEHLKLEKVVDYAADAVESIFSVGTERTMNAFNQSKIG